MATYGTRRVLAGGLLAMAVRALIGSDTSASKRKRSCDAPRGLTCKQDKRIRAILDARMRGFDALADRYGVATKLIEWPDDFSAIVEASYPDGTVAGVFVFDPETREYTPWQGCVMPDGTRETVFDRCYVTSRRGYPLMDYPDWRHWYLTN